MQMNIGKRKRLNSEINVTPFVDVSLVLLVIFMVAAPIMVTGVQVDLPQTSAAAISGQDEPLVITVDHKGTVFLQEHEVPIHELSEKLQAITQAKADTRIFVRGDKRLDYGAIMQVFSTIQNAGYKHVALVTESEN